MEEKEREWQYDAFISYRHLEPDAFVAGSLHKILESYKLPGNLVKANGEKLKRTKIKKVFRDAEELPLTSNLNDTIMTALENSEYLIAICSPKFGESLWCKKEVDTFIKLRGADHVLTVLVDGEPSESFPEALLYKEVDQMQDDGSIITVREPMEPLAANARGANNRERLKLLKTESLRLMAPMFGCSFDDLKQRHREQKLKRTIQIIAAIAAVFLIFGIVSASMALQISKQNSKILKQNEQITDQAKLIEEQFEEAIISNANAVADYARNIYEDGDRVEAIVKAESVLSKVTYVPKVEYVLSDALNLYENGRLLKADRIIKCGALVESIFLSPSGEVIVARTNDNVVSVWDTTTGKHIANLISEDGWGWNSRENSVVFKDDNSFYCVMDKKIIRYDIAEQLSEVIAENVEDNCMISYSKDTNRLIAFDSSGAKIYDTTTEKLIAKVEREFSCMEYSPIVSGRDDYFALAVSSENYDEVEILICDATNGKEIDTFTINGLSISVASMKFYGNELFVLTNETVNGERSYMDMSSYLAVLRAYNIDENGVSHKWNKEFKEVYAKDVYSTNGGNSDNLVCSFYDRADLLDRSNGQLLCSYGADSEIVKVYGYKESFIYSVVTRDGRWMVLSPDNTEMMDTGFFASVSNNIQLFETGGCSVTVDYTSGEIIIYRYAMSEGAEQLDEEVVKERNTVEFDLETRDMLKEAGLNDAFVHNICYDNNHRFMGVVYMNRSMEVYSIDSNNKIVDLCANFTNLGIYPDEIRFSPDETIVLISDSSHAFVLRYDNNDTSKQFPAQEDTVASINNYCGVDFDEQIVFIKNNDTYYKVPLYSTDKIAEIAKSLIDEIR